MNPGTIVYAKPDPAVVGREQAERRPILIVSGTAFAQHIPDLVIAVPLTTRNRGLNHHVPIVGSETGLDAPTWALCEQVRAVSTARLMKVLGTASYETIQTVRRTIALFLEL